MDVDEVLRKRVKLFDSARHGHGEANSSSTAANLNMAAYDTYPATLPQRLPTPRHQAGYPPNMDPPPSAPNIAIDESIDAFAVREFAGSVIAVDCGICGCHTALDQEKLITLFKSAAAEPGCEQVEFLMKCSACAGKTCPGCATAVTASGMSYGSTARNAVHETWHCDRGRLALIWFLLCGYDHVVIHNKPQTAGSLKPKTQAPDDELTGRRRSKGKQTGFSGIGYSSHGADDFEDEFNYFSDTQQSNHFSHTQQYNHFSDTQLYLSSSGEATSFKGWKGSPLPKLQGSPMKRHKRKSSVPKPAPVDQDDSITTHIMCLVSAALPSITDRLPATKFDFEPPHFLASMLRRSSILDKAAELLRNDSLDNASQRYSLYDSVISFINTVNSGGQLMTSILHELRQINKAGHDLLKVSFSQPTRVTSESADTAQSLATCMDNLARQSERMLKMMQRSAGDIENEEDQRTLLLCTIISDCAAALSKEKAKLQSAASVTGTQQKTDEQWQKDLVVLPVADDTIMKHHHHAREAKALLEVSNPPLRRVSHIFKEIVTLETSLPPGIFVRYGETRVDVMQIVIIGPQGTPYENGMFEFDLFCPLEYPNVAPKMMLRTTGGGTVGFNPNLYATGKVCLSLLGTWEGETWEPGKSTLLQVLVSIQAMIFNDEPWCNEPGRESDRGTEQSKSYNRHIYDKVVKFGMIEWLEHKRSKKGTDKYGHVLGTCTGANKEKEEDIWADVAKKHFEAAEDEIIKTVCNWVNDRPPPRAGARKGKGKQVHFSGLPFGTPFAGPGRTIAEAADNSGPSMPLPFDPSKLKQSGDLASKLKEVVKELQSNARSYAGFYGDQEEGPWGDEEI